MDVKQWLQLPETRAFKAEMERGEAMARAQLEMACRETNDVRVKSAYESWLLAVRNVKAFERRGDTNGERNADSSVNDV